ncbi:MAG: glycosyltransferase [Planctomycetes bacterium]|nr:glycosyltransferase [Planctomycetota bacterium]
MPTYNGAAHLESAMETLLAQRNRDFDVVVVDDGSTDDTLKILKVYANQLPMTVVEREHEGNWVTNTNIGMSLAKGNYLCWLHQDDMWSPDRLVQLKRLTLKWPDAPLLLHPSWFIDAGGKRIGLWRCPLPRRTACLQSRTLLERLLIQNFVAASAPVFRAADAARVGRMDERLWYVADWDYWLKLARLGQTIYHPVPLTSFRVHPASQTSTRTDCTDDLRRQHMVVLARHLAEWERCQPRGRQIGRISRFSASLNLELMRLAAGRRIAWFRLVRGFLRLGPAGWYVFFRDSRIVERSVSRMRAGLTTAASRKTGHLCSSEHDSGEILDQ